MVRPARVGFFGRFSSACGLAAASFPSVSGPKKPTTPSKTRRKLAFAALCVTLGALAAGLIWTRTDGAITDDFVAAVPAESALDAVASYLGVAAEHWTLGARPADANTPDPERFREEIAPFLAEPAAANASDSVVFVGSSSIRLWSTLAADFPERAVLNRGFGGSTFSDLLHFHDELVDDRHLVPTDNIALGR